MLDRYEAKRDFERTPEPRPGGGGPGWGSLRFVVQKHAARNLHYDLRLEIDGTLKSWPVPKGPSFDPKDKRLAVMVEDHPLEYLTFEAVIAPGNYGAGQMIVWDTGIYSPDENGVLSFGDRETSDRRMIEGLEAGKLSFTLHGHKLRGSWTLVKTTRAEKEWLLIKHKDRFAQADRDVLDDGVSVLSKLTIDDLKAGRLPDPTPLDQRLARLGTQASFPAKIKPMLAKLIDDPFTDDAWILAEDTRVPPATEGPASHRTLTVPVDGPVRAWTLWMQLADPRHGRPDTAYPLPPDQLGRTVARGRVSRSEVPCSLR